MIDVAPDAVGYVDAEWLRGAGRPSAITVDEKLVVRLGQREQQAAAEIAPDVAALQAFAAVAIDAAHVAAEGDSERVEVTGAGVLAALVRAELGTELDGGTPDAIVDTTGDPATIAAALAKLNAGGRLVLAGEPLGRRMDIDLYPDVHTRGLWVIGAPPLLARGLAPLPSAFDIPPLGQVGPTEPAESGPLWFRVVG